MYDYSCRPYYRSILFKLKNYDKYYTKLYSRQSQYCGRVMWVVRVNDNNKLIIQ